VFHGLSAGKIVHPPIEGWFPDGACVGVAEGRGVGVATPVGTGVGVAAPVGTGVGVGVGTGVGVAVAAPVGTGVGVEVGAPVGTGVEVGAPGAGGEADPPPLQPVTKNMPEQRQVPTLKMRTSFIAIPFLRMFGRPPMHLHQRAAGRRPESAET
jgi:hypothetical protein